MFLFTNSLVSQTLSYDSVLSKIDSLEKNQEYDRALHFINQHLTCFSDHWFELSKEIIYLNKKTGRLADNLEVFNEAHRNGYFYFIHPGMKEYEPYLSMPGFDSISKSDLQLMAEANQVSETKYEIQLPENFQQNKEYPLVLIFHGGGKNIEDAKQHWNEATFDNSFIKVYLQSYRHFDSKTFGWPNNDKRLDNEMAEIFDDLMSAYEIDQSMIFACGISVGASAAIDLSLRNIIPVKGLMAICPAIPRIIIENQSELVTNNKLQVFILSGENDHFLDRQKKMIAVFDDLNLEYKHEIVTDMGHEYPKNESLFINQFIHFMNDIK